MELVLPAKLETRQVLKSVSVRKPSSLRRARLNPPAYSEQQEGGDTAGDAEEDAPAAAASLLRSLSAHTQRPISSKTRGKPCRRQSQVSHTRTRGKS